MYHYCQRVRYLNQQHVNLFFKIYFSTTRKKTALSRGQEDRASEESGWQTGSKESWNNREMCPTKCDLSWSRNIYNIHLDNLVKTFP